MRERSKQQLWTSRELHQQEAIYPSLDIPNDRVGAACAAPFDLDKTGRTFHPTSIAFNYCYWLMAL